MKIGILTLPLINNYGGLLQNYALQTYLKRLGHEVITINSVKQISCTQKYRFLLSYIKRSIQKYIFKDKKILFTNVIKQIIFENTQSIHTKEFIQKNINAIDVKDKITNELCTQYKFDAFIVGSDQVWRNNFAPDILNNFLDFAEASKAIQLAYAASFGVDSWDYSEELTIRINKLIKRFDAISVRERSGVDLCAKYLNVDAQCLLDPTMLLSKTDYIELINATSEKIPDDELLIYVLDWTKDKQKIIDEIASKKKLNPFEVGKPSKNGYPSVESWINGFKNAKFVITDSFHGTVFSILFNIPFITIANEGRGLTRFTSLLETFDLTDRLIFKFCDLKITDLDIDFSKVNPIVEDERQKSYQFINSKLNLK